MKSASRILSGLLVVGGVATMALAAWSSPFGANLLHDDDKTCGLEPCERACRVCCAYFNGGPGMNNYDECLVMCAGLGPFC